MFSRPRQSVLRLTLVGLLLLVTVAGRTLHWRSVTPELGRETACACHGHSSPRPAGNRDTIPSFRAGRHVQHDSATCVICQFFATGQALALPTCVHHAPALVVGQTQLKPLLLQPTRSEFYEARGPPAAIVAT
jgi:hypothetical protein